MFQNKNIQNGMLKRLLFCVFIQLNVFSHSQTILNLINNYSAEQFNTCPNFPGQVDRAIPWFLPYRNASADYFNTCTTFTDISVPINGFGSQNARTGNGYFGFIIYGLKISGTEWKEYIESGLRQTLQLNKSYCITYNVSLAEISRYATANIGVLFSNDSIVNHSFIYPPPPFVLTPDFENTNIVSDTLNWVQIQGNYLANGTEKFITIGNFRTDATTTNTVVKPLDPNPGAFNMAYYYIDDISLIEINVANAFSKDSITKCALDSVTLGTDSTEFATYTWQSTAVGLAALSCTNCPNPIAKPLVTTKYYLTKQQCNATTIDSVMVVVLTPTTQANAGNDKIICIGDFVQLGVSDSLYFTNYSWQNAATLSCTNCAMPFANPNVTTTYTVQRTECANVTTDTVRIIIDDCEPTFVLPNVFTPNGDEINDTWGINFSTVNSHITNFKMSIYDRWGLLVYSTNYELSTPNSKWDGRTSAGIECKPGVYFYVITFDKNTETQKLTGHLSLFR